MKPIDTGNTGVIAPQDIPASESLQHAAATSHEPAVSAVQATQQAIPDVPLGQWPAEVAEPESPALVYARKLAEDQQNAGTMPAGLGLGGLTGQPVADTQNLLNAVPTDVSSLLSGAQTSITEAAQQAQTAATSALTGATSALTSGELQKQVASIADTAGLSSVISDPASAVNSLLNGASLSALPGVDQLISPILQLLSSFGSGVMGALDPTAIMSSASSVIESAMGVGQGAITSVQQLWEGTASEQATTAAQQANTQGTETSQRGFDISDLTQKAAAVVQTGNTQLTGIATSFASQAVAMAPVILTPPGQAALVASATEHLGNAVSVVNATRGDLSGKTTELNAMLSNLLGQSGLPSVQEVAQTVAQNVAEPLSTTAQEAATQAQSALSSGSPGSTSPTTPASTNPSAANTGTPGTTSVLGTGTPRTGTGTPRTGTGTGNPSTGNPASKGVSGVPGTVSPLRAATVPTGLGTGLNAATTPAGTGNSFMGNPAGAGANRGNNDDDEHDRNVTPYQSLTGNDDLTGPLGESTPDVIGATHSDEMLGMDYEQDQF
ncbi:hypothetical protein [Nocardia sp. XZ_19_385]|uniref:hypothetical protein n=1 Tax=Nocardia sp. XZ_19_385 TaxID=2769488 RepID=UPI00188F18E5|nr:hypothetical protein [Nocardia sp. XZ_19_385]